MTGDDLLNVIIERRDYYQSLLDKGKGVWTGKDYVKDDTWAGWSYVVVVLDRIILEAR